jgi:hypothetical protein
MGNQAVDNPSHLKGIRWQTGGKWTESRTTVGPKSLKLLMRRGAGVVERGGLENRCTRERTVGSNPTPSASIHI